MGVPCDIVDSYRQCTQWRLDIALCKKAEHRPSFNIIFRDHLCLLSGMSPLPKGEGEGEGYKNKKPFIHNRDEEFSPRYHPVC